MAMFMLIARGCKLTFQKEFKTLKSDDTLKLATLLHFVEMP